MTKREAIECRVTPWYFRRLGIMALVLAGCGGWFLYDGMVGWPEANHRRDVYDAFQASRDGDSWDVFAGGRAWEAGSEEERELREAFEAGGTEVRWMDFAAERRLPAEAPERHPESAIEGQFHWAYGSFILAGGVLVVLLVNAPKKLRADAEAFYTPGGERVPFAAITKIDKRKWENKGLAFAHFRDESGKVRKAVIDDLKFAGAGRILERALEDFEGELIERAPSHDGDDEEEEGA